MAGICGIVSNTLINYPYKERFFNSSDHFETEYAYLRRSPHCILGANPFFKITDSDYSSKRDQSRKIDRYSHLLQDTSIVSDARIDNRLDIYNHLSLGLEEDLHDEELIHLVFARWGKKGLDLLAGDFCAAIYEDSTKTLSLISDHTGVRPVFYYEGSNFLLFSSSISGVHAGLGEAPRVNEVVLVEYLLHVYSRFTDQTLFTGIKKLLPGSVLTYRNQRVSVEQYSTLGGKKAPEYRDDSEYYEHFREIYERVVQSQLITESGSAIVHISGGLDSTSNAAIASNLQLSSRTKTQLYGLCSITPHYPNEDEWYFQEKVFAQYQNIIPIIQNCEEYWALKDFSKQGLRACFQPENFPIRRWLQSHLQIAQEVPTKVILSAQSADFVHGWTDVGSLNASIRFNSKHFSSDLLQFFKNNSVFRGRILKETLRSYLSFTSYHNLGVLKKTYNTPWINRYNVFKLLKNSPYQFPYTDQLERVRGLNASGRRVLLWAWSGYNSLWNSVLDIDRRAYGVEFRDPFSSREMIDFFIGIPDSLRQRGSIKKYLLREALKALLPKEIYSRSHSTYLQETILYGLKKYEKINIDKQIDSSQLEEYGYAIPGRFKREWQSYLSGQRSQNHQFFDYILASYSFNQLVQEGKLSVVNLY